MKRYLAVFLVCVILVAVLLPNVLTSIFDLKTMTRILEILGENAVPTLTGGYEFDSFSSGATAVLYITSYPIRLIFYGVQQISTFTKYISNPDSIPPDLGWTPYKIGV